jgi:ABC-type nickel/cobalt efflux system permease component RcnA
MMGESVGALLFLGFVFGLRHALDPDHLVAVSTIVSEHKTVSRSSLVGSFWGLGHTTSLLAVGLSLLLLRVSIPENLLPFMEAPVAVMLMLLGVIALWRLANDRGIRVHTHVHAHDSAPPHAHVHIHSGGAHDHAHHLFRLGRRPFIVGLVHGVAGSAALALAVLATIPSITLGILYIAVFGVGSIGGMLLMSAVISLPFVITTRRLADLNGWIRLIAGVSSILFGAVLAWKLAIEILHKAS